MPITECRHFTGHKPCGKSSLCDHSCAHKNIPSINILMVHLGALGAVVRSTSLLASIHRRYPGARIFWVTDRPAHHLLLGHPLIDSVFCTSESDLLELSAWDFDIALVIDKSRKAAGVLRRISVDQVLGFQMEAHSGAILPASKAAVELWEIGLDDQRKFFQNQKTEAQLIHESLELGPYLRDEYNLPLSIAEQKLADERRQAWKLNPSQPIIGLNTGASPVIPAKKWTVEFQRQLLSQWFQSGLRNLVLLGGPEDTDRNRAIAEGLPVLQSPTGQGLRDGLSSVEACDIIMSGDSLGMHMAIARKKYVVAWFGPTCSQEIDLFDRGEKIMAQVDCGPCWKRVCEKPVMCYDRVSFQQIQSALEKGFSWWQNNQQQNQFLSSRQPSSEISF